MAKDLVHDEAVTTGIPVSSYARLLLLVFGVGSVHFLLRLTYLGGASGSTSDPTASCSCEPRSIHKEPWSTKSHQSSEQGEASRQ